MAKRTAAQKRARAKANKTMRVVRRLRDGAVFPYNPQMERQHLGNGKIVEKLRPGFALERYKPGEKIEEDPAAAGIEKEADESEGNGEGGEGGEGGGDEGDEG